MRRRIGSISPGGGYRRGGSSAPEENQSARFKVRDFEHVCHTLSKRDTRIPHVVKSGPYKGKRAFQSEREIRQYEAQVAHEGGMDIKYDRE